MNKKNLNRQNICDIKVKSLGIIFLMIFVINNSLQAYDKIADAYKSRDYQKLISLKLNEDGSSCIKTTVKGVNQLSTTVEEDLSKACKSLKVARRIQEKLGSCTYKSKEKIYKDSDQNAWSQMVVTDKNGIEINNSHDNLTADIPQECLCGKIISRDSDFGLGMLNPLNLIFDGPYYKSEASFESVSGQECASAFDTEYEKNVVLEAYKEFHRP